MPPSNPKPDQTLHEELVAYLDGELDAESCRQLEERLTKDDGARKELRQLEKVWDMLEQLPRSEVGEKFTKTTVEMVAVAVRKDLDAEQRAIPAKRLRWGVLAAASVLLAGLVGFGAMVALLPDKNAALLNELPVIEDLELLQKAESIAFLQGLHDQGIFVSDLASTAIDEQPPEETLPERRARVESLGVMDRERLQRLFTQFQALPVGEQARLRQLHKQIYASPELYQTLLQYFEWLKNLQSSERAELLAEATEKRLDHIHELKKKQDASALRQLVRDAKLTEADAKVIFAWTEQIALANEQKILAALPEDRRQWFEKADKESQIRKRMITGMALMMWGRDDSELPKIEPAEINKLMNDLSPEARGILQRQPDLKGKLAILHEWTKKALYVVGGQGPRNFAQVPKEELMKHFETLPQVEKDKLLALSQDEMLAKLRELHFRKNGPWRGGFGSGNRPGGRWPSGFQPGQRPDRPGETGGDRPGGPGKRNPDDRPPGDFGPPRDPNAGPPRDANGPPSREPGSVPPPMPSLPEPPIDQQRSDANGHSPQTG